jgi:hypothetical protein
MVRLSHSADESTSTVIDRFAKAATPIQIRAYVATHAIEPASRARIKEAIRRWGLFEKDGQFFIGRRWK